MATPNSIASRVHRARTRKGWTRQQLAHESKLSISTVTSVEQGRRPNPSSQTISALAAALEVDPSVLLGQPRRSSSHS